ncbi:hypothetical protein FQA39_LY18178 [Lamprigera yunnana]|nr:hypothetical protein FQA39_LY18178 [Lamprigera yunnana]
MQLAHALRSGPITIVDQQTFLIENLHYDGKGPDAHFWIGRGPWPSDNGTLVPDENGSTANLKAYAGKNVTVKLTGDVTVDEVDYLAVWCIKFKHNFGHTFVRKKRPRTSTAVELEPLKELAHGLRSGPVVIVDKKTIFVPNLYYDGEGPDAHFWVGKGDVPTSDGILVANEKGSSNPLTAYTGQNVYITLPYNVTSDDIDYFAVWCIQFRRNFGHVVLPKNVTSPPINGNPRYTYEGAEIVRVKKCCPTNQVLMQSGCTESNRKFNLTVNVQNRIGDIPIKNVTFVPFTQKIICKHRTYPLDQREDEFSLLTNGSLAYNQELVPQDSYCFETVNLDSQNEYWTTTAIVCLGSSSASFSGSVFVMYGIGVLLSTICLTLTALILLFGRDTFNARDKCIVFYSISMATTFACLAVSQFSVLNEYTCAVIAYVIQFFLISSFTWLSTMSTETYFKIRYYNNILYTNDRRRSYVYLSVGMFIPTLIFIISLSIDRVPDIPTIVLKQHFGRSECWFGNNETTYFYVPIGVAIVYNIILGVLMKIKLLHLQENRSTDISWLSTQRSLKLMFRSGCFLLTLMSVSWITEITSIILDSDESIWLAIDIANSLQGVIVFIIFVAYGTGTNLSKKRSTSQDDRMSTNDRRSTLLSST